MTLPKFRLNVPLQFVGHGLSFLRAVAWCVLLVTIMRRIETDWIDWAVLWAVVVLNIVCWALYSLFDVDGDGAEGLG